MTLRFYLGIGSITAGKVQASALDALLLKRYDGFTMTGGRGAWKDADGKPVVEPCLVITVLDAPPGDDGINTATEIANLLGEQAVIVTDSVERPITCYGATLQR